ncbi:hypothetical protein VPH35_078092 [Triticum aestivum]
MREERREGVPVVDRRGSLAGAGLRRRGQMRSGGWWQLNPLLDSSLFTSLLPTTEHGPGSMGSTTAAGSQEGWPRTRVRTRGLKRVFLCSSCGQGRGQRRGVE